MTDGVRTTAVRAGDIVRLETAHEAPICIRFIAEPEPGRSHVIRHSIEICEAGRENQPLVVIKSPAAGVLFAETRNY